MTEFFRNLITCCLRRQQNDDSSSPIEYSGDVTYFCVPRDNMDSYFADGPKKRKLNIKKFMWLYQYTTNDLFEKPGHGYMYEKFVLVVDGEYMRVEGWVPIPKLDLSWCDDDRTRVDYSIHQKRPAKENVVCVDICKNITRTEKLIGINEDDIYTGKALLMSKSERNRVRFFSYSRHMNIYELQHFNHILRLD